MNYHQIKNSYDALVYFADCQLATVEDCMVKKSTPIGDFRRHIAIAQKMIDQLVKLKITLSNGHRAKEIIEKYDTVVMKYVIDNDFFSRKNWQTYLTNKSEIGTILSCGTKEI